MPDDTYLWDAGTLGAALRKRRRALGFRQSDVARDLRCSLRLVSELERGRATVAFGTVLRYAGYLGMDLVLRGRG